MTIVSVGGPDDARRLFDKAMTYYDTGVVNEHGKLITGEVGQGCVQVYIWPDEDGKK